MEAALELLLLGDPDEDHGGRRLAGADCSTVGSQEPISALSSARSSTSKSRTAHQKAASRSGSWQSTTNSVSRPATYAAPPAGTRATPA
ncbi:hypothetical protein GCM10018771_33930 [Streptomyces cellulosae]|nr:hypothetical protein GCM10018771_33930 [Streptomyces cellulosae]